MSAHINKQAYEFYEESRKYPRIKVSLPIKLYVSDQQSVDANIYDISPDGLQVRCNRRVALAINPSAKKITSENKLVMKSEFQLPLDGEEKSISVDCEIYYFVIIDKESDEDVAFGLQFNSLPRESIQNINRYIIEQLEPAVA